VTLSARTWPRSESSSWPAMRPTYQMGTAGRKAFVRRQRPTRGKGNKRRGPMM
jgi:hypothetical protein